jgi:hypothetical protein
MSTVPEIFLELPDERMRDLYGRIYSSLLISGQLEAFQNAAQNDVCRFLNSISVTGYTVHEIEEGLMGVHYALTYGPAMFLRNYCHPVE